MQTERAEALMKYFHELADQPRIVVALIEYFEKRHANSHGIILSNAEDLPLIVLEYVKKAGLVIDNCKFFKMKPGSRGLVHTDGIGRIGGVNIPLFSIGGVMNWYNQDWSAITRLNQDGLIILKMAAPKARAISTVSLVANSDEAVFQAECESRAFTAGALPAANLILTKPTIVLVNEWHEIDNTKNQETRIIFTMRFRSNPKLDEMVKAFSKIEPL